MAKIPQPYKFQDFSGGQANDVNPNLLPKQCVDLGMNLDFDVEIGSAVSRPGTAIRGAQLVAGKNILGLFQFIDTATSANNKLFATVNVSNDATSVIYDVVAGTTSQTGLTASTKMRFINFQNATLAINGADAERSYTNAGWITTGGAFDLANIPSSNKVKYVRVFLDRVYLAGDTAQPTRLYYSGVATGGAVSWTSGNGFVDVNGGSDDGPITGLGKVPGYILVFKERAMSRWNYSSAFPEELVNIGTSSQESVVEGGGLCAFYSSSNENDKGFFITNGGRPQPISHDTTRPIRKWINAITSANEGIMAGWATNHGFSWSIGDVTVDGEDWPNVVLKYNRLLNQWAVRSYPSEFKVFARELVSGVNTIVGGDDAGTIYRVDKAGTYSDNGTAIAWRLRTRPTDYGSNQKKEVQDRVSVKGRNLEGATLAGIIDEDRTNSVPLGSETMYRKILRLFNVGKKLEFTNVMVEVQGMTLNNQAVIREIETPSVDVTQEYT